MMLSNKAGDTELNHRAIVTMGDTLGELRPLRAVMFPLSCNSGSTAAMSPCMSLLAWMYVGAEMGCARMCPQSCSACAVAGMRCWWILLPFMLADESGSGTSLSCSFGDTWSGWTQGGHM